MYKEYCIKEHINYYISWHDAKDDIYGELDLEFDDYDDNIESVVNVK